MRFFDEFGQGIQLFTGVFTATRSTDSSDEGSVIEKFELFSLDQIRELLNHHTKTKIGFVVTIFLERLGKGHSWKIDNVEPFHLFENIFRQSFEHVQHILLVNIGHFAVDLGEFRLTVRTQVLVPETLDNLIITIKPSHHQQLLEKLWRLR